MIYKCNCKTNLSPRISEPLCLQKREFLKTPPLSQDEEFQEVTFANKKNRKEILGRELANMIELTNQHTA